MLVRLDSAVGAGDVGYSTAGDSYSGAGVGAGGDSYGTGVGGDSYGGAGVGGAGGYDAGGFSAPAPAPLSAIERMRQKARRPVQALTRKLSSIQASKY